MKTIPDFLIIGAQKSGTSTLDAFLSQHPDIYFPETKENNYYALQGRPPAWTGPGDEVANDLSIYNQQDYQQLFKKNVRALPQGESSVLYLYSESAAQAIHSDNPQMKLIVILRNPVYRAFSAWQHLRRDKRETETDFRKALDLEVHRIQEGYESLWHHKKVGLYGEQLERYFKLFPRENIKIFLNEDLRQSSTEVARSCYDFIGVDPDFRPELGFSMNTSGIPRFQAINDFFNRPHAAKKYLKKIIPLTFARRLKSSIQNINLEEKTHLSEDDKQYLMNFFREDILLTEQLTGRSLKHWLE